MKACVRHGLVVIALAVFLTSSGTVFGAACVAIASTAWNVKTTWGTLANGCAGSGLGAGETPGIPGAGDSVSIGVTGTPLAVTVPGAYTALASSVAIGGTGTNGISSLTLSANTSGLTVGGAVTIIAPGNNNVNGLMVNVGTASMASLSITGAGAGRVARLAISTGTTTVTGNIAFVGTAGNAQITFSGTGTLKVGGAFGNGGTFTASTGTVEYNGSGQTVNNAYTYNNLTINSGGAATLSANALVGGALTVTAGTLSTSTFTLGVAGNFVVNGTLSGTGAVTLTGTGTNIGGTGSITNTAILTISTGAKTILSTADLTFAGTVAITGAIVVTNNGIVTLTATGNSLTGVAGSTWINAASSRLNVSGAVFAVNGTLTASASPNTVNYQGGNQNIETPSVVSGAATYNNLELTGSGTKTAAAAFTVAGKLTITGVTFASVTFIHTVKGDIDNTGIHTSTTGRIALSGGTAPHVLTGTGTYGNLELNDSQGAAKSTDLTVSGVLTLTTGIISIGSNTLISSAACPGSMSRTAGWVAGNVKLSFPTGTPVTCTFHIGDATSYRPIAVTFASISAAGSVTGGVTQAAGDHPNIATSIIESALSVNRYWTLTNTGVTFTTYSAIFTFINPGDLDAGIDPLVFSAQRFAAAAWNATTSGARTTTTTQITGETGFGEFALGTIKGNTPKLGRFNAYETTTPVAATSTTGVIKTKISGTSFNIDLVAITSAGTAIDTTFTGANVIVQLMNASDDSGALDLDGSGCRSTSWQIVQTLTNQTFIAGDAGRHRYNGIVPAVSYPKVRFRVQNSSGSLVGCSTDPFAIRPATLTPGASDADWATAGPTRALINTGTTGGNVHKAGQPFTLSATAQPTASNKTYTGNPTVKTVACVLPTGCVTGSLTSPSVWGGAGTRTSTVSYSEVGTFNVELEDQTFADVDINDSTTAERYIPPTLPQPVTLGRFVPDHFIVAPAAGNTPKFQTFGVPDTSCATGAPLPKRSFTYIGQSFGYETLPQALITAQNAANVTTVNYSQNLWKIAPSNVTQTYSTTQARDADVINAPTVSKLDDGTGTVTASISDRLAFNRSITTPQALFNASISLSMSVVDDSEVGSPVITGNGAISTTTATSFNGTGSGILFDSGNAFRYGRLRLGSAGGSQLVNLQVPLETQYWNGTIFVTNAADHCTAIAPSTIALSNYVGSLAACETGAISGSSFVAGKGDLRLRAPGPGTPPTDLNTGSVDLAVNLGITAAGNTCTSTLAGVPISEAVALGNRAYLQGKWSGGTYTENPSARARFGVYRGSDEVIFLRESY
jgi:hypothetical protein